jgi:ribose transport system substrate-binding protein
MRIDSLAECVKCPLADQTIERAVGKWWTELAEPESVGRLGGTQECAVVLDIPIDTRRAPVRQDGEVQAQRVRQALNEGVDGILISASDAGKVTGAINDAVDRGVPVMTFDSDAPDSRRFAFSGVDDVKAGEMIMEELARLVPHTAHVAVLAGNRAAPNLIRRVEGVLRGAARHPDLKVVGTFYTVETPEEASATVIQVDAAQHFDGAVTRAQRLYLKHAAPGRRRDRDRPR